MPTYSWLALLPGWPASWPGDLCMQEWLGLAAWLAGWPSGRGDPCMQEAKPRLLVLHVKIGVELRRP